MCQNINVSESVSVKLSISVYCINVSERKVSENQCVRTESVRKSMCHNLTQCMYRYVPLPSMASKFLISLRSFSPSSLDILSPSKRAKNLLSRTASSLSVKYPDWKSGKLDKSFALSSDLMCQLRLLGKKKNR